MSSKDFTTSTTSDSTPTTPNQRISLYSARMKWLADRCEKFTGEPQLGYVLLADIEFLADLLSVECNDSIFSPEDRQAMKFSIDILKATCVSFRESHPQCNN